MPVVDRCIYREVLPPLLQAVAVFTCFHLLDRIHFFTDLAASGVRLSLVVPLALFMVPSFLIHTLPMGLLMAVLVAAGRLASEREVVAFHASGLSPLRLFRPFLLVALVVASIDAVLTLGVEQRAHEAFYRQLYWVTRARLTAVLQARTFSALDKFVIYADEVSPARSEIRGVLLSEEQPSNRLRLVTAPRADLISDDRGERVVLRLKNGAIHESDRESPAWYRQTTFALYDISVAPDRRGARLDWTEKPEKRMSTWDLLSQTRAFTWEGEIPWAFLLEFHKRLAFPLSPVIFTAIAFPLAVRVNPTGRGTAMLLSLPVLVLYYMLVNGLGSASHRNQIPAWVAAWAPVTLFGVAGLVLLLSTRTAVRAPRIGSLQRERPPLAEPVQSVTAGVKRSGRLGSIVDRHLLRGFLGLFGYGVLTAAALFIAVDFFEILDRYLRVQPPWTHIVEHVVYRMPGALYRASPFITLIATTVLFMQLNRHRELTALKAAGMSLHRVSVPVLLLSVALAASSLAFQESVLPGLNRSADEVDRVKIRGEAPRHLQQRTRIWFRGSDSRFFRMDLLDPMKREMDGVTVLEMDPGFRVLHRVDAVRARWVGAEWEFERGTVRDFGPSSGAVPNVFERHTPRLTERFESFLRAQTPPDAMSFRELSEYVRALRQRGHLPGAYVVLLHAKLSFPLAHIAFALLAIPCALRWPSDRRLAGLALAAVLGIGYWLANSVAMSLGKAEILPPLIAVWTPNIVFAGAGLYLLVRART
jgi:LPS export ABC transporter permease LptG/LPS export ABC transporter permease LptF